MTLRNSSDLVTGRMPIILFKDFRVRGFKGDSGKLNGFSDVRGGGNVALKETSPYCLVGNFVEKIFPKFSLFLFHDGAHQWN